MEVVLDGGEPLNAVVDDVPLENGVLTYKGKRGDRHILIRPTTVALFWIIGLHYYGAATFFTPPRVTSLPEVRPPDTLSRGNNVSHVLHLSFLRKEK